MSPRWTMALTGSLLLHTGAAIGGLIGWEAAPSFEATAGEARVVMMVRPTPPSVPPSAVGLEMDRKPRIKEPFAALPEMEGVEASVLASLRNPPPPYPPEAFRRGIEGVAALLVTVSPEGDPIGLILEGSSGSILLDEAATQAVARWTFHPARRAGIPATGRIRIRIRFQIVEVGLR